MRILLVEDDTLLGNGVCAGLRRENNAITNKYVDYTACYCRSVSSSDAAVERTGMADIFSLQYLHFLHPCRSYLQRDLQ